MLDPPVVVAVFAIHAKFCVKAERRHDFLSVLKHYYILNKEQKSNNNDSDILSSPFLVLGQDVDDEDVFYLHEEYSKRRSSSRTKEEDHGDAGHPHPRHSMNTTNNFVDFMNLFATKLSLLTEPPQVDEFVLLHDAAAAAPSKTHVPSSSSSSSGVFCVNAQLCVRPELRDEFLAIVAALKRHADDPDDEPLCIQFTYGESIHTPNTIHLHERYIGANGGLQGFQAHEASPHLEPCRKFMATRHPAFTKPPVMQKYYRRLLLPPVAAAALLSPL